MISRAALAESIYAFEERAGILEFEGGMTREAAEREAERQLGDRQPWRGSILNVIDAGAEATTSQGTADTTAGASETAGNSGLKTAA